MAIDLGTNNNILATRTFNNNFVEDELVLLGSGAITVTQSGDSATFVFDASATPLAVEQDGVSVGDFATLDFGEYLTAVDNAGEALIGVSGLVTTNTVQTIDADKTFGGDVIVEGNFTVSGTTTTVLSETVLVEDNIFGLNTNHTGAPTEDAGLYVERGTEDGVIVFWDESEDHWAIGITTDSGATITSVDNLVYASELTTVSGDLVTYVNTVSGDLSSEIDADIASLSGYAEGAFVNTSGDTMTGFLTLNADPTANLHAATKQYVDSSVAGAVVDAQNDGAAVHDAVGTFNFETGLAATSGAGGVLNISVSGVASTADLLSYSGYAESQFIDTTEIVTISGDAVSEANTYTDGEITSLSGFVDTNFIDTTEIVTISGDAVSTANTYTDGEITSLSGYAEGAFVNVSGDTMTGFLTLNADPTANLHAATKQYVDSSVAAVAVSGSNDGSLVHGEVQNFDFGTGLVASSGTAGTLEVNVSGVVLTTTNQSIAGDKTFTGDTVMDGLLTSNAGFVTSSGATPASASATGQEGEIRWSDDYLYVAVGTNSWKRTPIMTWA